MRRVFTLMLIVLLGLLRMSAAAAMVIPPVSATVESTLESESGKIRQFALDGDLTSFFASARPAKSGDHFTVRFDRPVEVRTLRITTGRPDAAERLETGHVEVSSDGQDYETVAQFKAGAAEVRFSGRLILSVRIKPATDLLHPLVIREILVDARPCVAIFKYPVEFTVNASDAPELKDWAERAARVCERAYPMINDELSSDGFKPPHQVTMTLKRDYNGVAATAGTRITGSVRYFQAHPDDIGAMVHETVHVVQRYRTRNNPGWLVEGIADYIRFFKHEPEKLGRINPQRAKYNGSYRVSAAFLAYLTEKYDPHIVRKLNQMLREGEYREEVFKAWTGKTLPELDAEWRESLTAS